MLLKNIKDIELNNGLWIISRSITLDLNSLNEELEMMDYTGNGRIKDEAIENARLPPFAQVFYYKVFQLHRIPSEDVFIDEYLKWTNIQIQDHNLFTYNHVQYSLESLKGRILRTYPSLIRDLHFYYYLLESKKFDGVNYSLSKDYFDGIDITIDYNRTTYAISIFINTNRGKEFKKAKENRHDYRDVKEIILNVDFDHLYKIGHFFVLGEAQLNEIIKKIDMIQQLD